MNSEYNPRINACIILNSDFTHRFGTASFCRQGNYGMPQFVTNTMRICTREASSKVSYDAAVPTAPRFYNATSGQYSANPDFESAPEHCSDSPFDVPWSLEDVSVAENPAAMFSVGSVPMWDGSRLSSNPKYPAGMMITYASPLQQTKSQSDPRQTMPCRRIRPADRKHRPRVPRIQLLDR
jgi:hypothetical protein